MRKIQENKGRLELNGTHQHLVYDDLRCYFTGRATTQIP